MAIVKKVGISEVQGSDGAILPAGTLVMYNIEGEGWQLRLHNGVDTGGLPIYSDANVVSLLASFGSNTISTTGNITGGNIAAVSGNIDVPFGSINAAGDVTANSFIGDGSQLTGLPASYGNANVATFLAAFGSNTISTTGNISAGNFTGSGTNVDIVASSYTWTFDDTGNLTLPGNTFAVNYANGTAVGLGGSYGNADVVTLLSEFGSNTITTTGNITGGNVITDGSVNVAGNVRLTSAEASDTTRMFADVSGSNTSLVLEVGDDNADSIVLRHYSFSASNVIDMLTATRSSNTAANVSVTGNLSATGNVTGANLVGSSTIYGNVDLVLGNIANASGAKTRITTFGSNSYIQTGNGTVGSTGNIVFAPYLDATEKVVIDTATGNVTAANFTGNITITGNVTGTSANVELVAGSYEWAFDDTGNLTLPGNTFAVNYANGMQVDIVTKFEGSWTVPTGNSTQSFTVDANNTYYMWVEGNIPNGIITWNATATITNINVPVVGAQYAWVYNGGGTPIDFTSLPNQFVGTANTIVRSSTAPSATTNRFDFGLNNTSGSPQTVRYGWIRIS